MCSFAIKKKITAVLRCTAVLALLETLNLYNGKENIMRLYDLKVNHLENPLGFRMQQCSFQWKVADAVGKHQTAARIVVAEDEGLQQLCADTGFQETADSLGTEVALELKPRTRYYWQVTVRTDAGEEQAGAVQWFETAKQQEPWQAVWISCNGAEKRHPFFEKRVELSGEVTRARLYICGLGLYEAYYTPDVVTLEEKPRITGMDYGMVRISDEHLAPYCNDYDRWVQYQTYDVTAQLQCSGKLSILLGNGWYKGRFGFKDSGAGGYYGDQWKLIAELHLEYADGSHQVIATDESWSVRRSKICFSTIYDGEQLNELLEELPLETAVSCEAPKGELTERMSLPVTVHERFTPAALLQTPAGEQVFDLGQEITGIFALRVKEPAGTVIHIQTGEMLQHGNFYNENLRSARSEYLYTCDGNEKYIVPHFTFYGYRFVKVTGVTHLQKEDFIGLAHYSNLKQVGAVETGHGLVNQLLSNIRWGLKGNFVDVPTDCPQRDERMGWTGDAQVFSPTATYLEDTYAFYAKYLYDMWQEQQDLKGMVPDVVPSFDVKSCATVWGDAACIIPWNLYEFYGDIQILKDQYPSMKAWVDYVRAFDGTEKAWRNKFHYGDWLALDNPAGGTDQVMGGTDEAFIASVYYAAMAELVAKAAGVLGLTEEEHSYRTLSEQLFAEIRWDYFSGSGRCCIKTQTALVLALKYHLSCDEELTKKQLKQLFESSGGKLKTGFVGTPLLCSVLTENGMEELAYSLLLNEEYPGWLHEVKLGATTVWERWNSLDENGCFSSTGMNSLNHYAYGSIAEWIFRYVAGLNQKPGSIGCREMVMKPLLHPALHHIKAYYDSPSGRYEISWELKEEQVSLRVSVPFGGKAYLTLPDASEAIYAASAAESANPMFAEVLAGACVLEAGEYTVTYQKER